MVIGMNGGFFVTFEIFLMQQWFLAICAVTMVIAMNGGFFVTFKIFLMQQWFLAI